MQVSQPRASQPQVFDIFYTTFSLFLLKDKCLSESEMWETVLAAIYL